MPLSSKNSRAFSIAPLIVLHLLIALPLAYFLNIWSDEASTLYTTQHGFLAAFQHAAIDERQAPLYFWILSLWRSINDSIFFARIFSLLCSLASIKFFSGVARHIFQPRTAFLVSAFFALHPFLIWASVEIRVYSLVILLSSVLLLLFIDGFWNDDETSQKRSRICFLIVTIVALYTNYYLGFLLAGFLAALLISKKRRLAGAYCGLMLIAAIAVSPLLLVFRTQLSANASGFHEATSLIDGLRTLWHQLLTFVLPAEVFPDQDISGADVIRVWSVRAFILLTVIFAIKNRKTVSPQTSSLGAITIAVFSCLLIAYFALGTGYVQVRHASVIFVPLVLFLTSLLSDIFSQESRIVRKIVGAAGAILILASFSYALVTLFPNMTKRGDWARIGAFVEQNESPGQPIIVFTTYDALALPYHYHGVNKILPDERFFEFEAEDKFGTENSLKGQTDFVISEIPAEANMIWLAVNEKCIVTDACRPLENYVQANYTIEKEQDFYLEKLFLLRKNAQ